MQHCSASISEINAGIHLPYSAQFFTICFFTMSHHFLKIKPEGFSVDTTEVTSDQIMIS